MTVAANILVVSDLHLGEELLPGASKERSDAVDRGARAFCDFVRFQGTRRLGGRPWRLVIAGDLFDFMSVVIPGSPELPARNSDERRFGLGRGTQAGVRRLDEICSRHSAVLRELVRFASAHHSIDIVVGNHDVELLEPDVVAVLERHLRQCGASDDALTRIRVVPWFVYIPGTVWIEHGHVYDEGCSFEFNLAPTDPKEDRLVWNADYSAVRYLGRASPDIDPHGIEEWSFGGFLRYGWGRGVRSFAHLIGAYCRFAWALIVAGWMHRSFSRRRARRSIHAERLEQAAARGGVTRDTARAIDHLARAPLTLSWRRLARLMLLDQWGVVASAGVVSLVLVIALPLAWGLALTLAVFAFASSLLRKLGNHTVASQLPMRAVPRRLQQIVDAPVVVFGHTHDPRWQEIDPPLIEPEPSEAPPRPAAPRSNRGVYINAGTWLPALRPGLRRSFTHVLIQPRSDQPPLVELRQWRGGASVPFDPSADLGAGVTSPSIPIARSRR